MSSGGCSRRAVLALSAAGFVSVAGCSALAGNDIQDSDGDGVIDSEDYAPRDPNVQERADIAGGTGTEPPATTTATPGRTDASTMTSSATPTPQPSFAQSPPPQERVEAVLSDVTVDTRLTFDNGVATEVSGNDRPVAVTGGSLVPGVYGQALDLTQQGDYLTVQSGLTPPADGADAKPFSYAAWVNLDSYSTPHEIFTNHGTRRRLGVNTDGELCGRMWGGNGALEGEARCSGGRVPLHTWTHVGFVFDGSEGRVYLNGDVVARAAWQGYTGSRTTCLGSDAQGGGDCDVEAGVFDGQVDEWTIFGEAVSGTVMRRLAGAAN